VLDVYPGENVEKLKKEGISLKKTMRLWAVYDPEILQNESETIINELNKEKEIVSVSFEPLFRQTREYFFRLL